MVKTIPSNPRKCKKAKATIIKPSNALGLHNAPFAMDKHDLQKMVASLKNDGDGFDYDNFETLATQYAPTFQTITLFIRLAKKYRRHFNSDSISLLMTLSDQCDLSPLQLLNLLKCYRLCNTKSGLAPYGCRFQFAKKKQQKCPNLVSVAPKIEDAILGLKITCYMLEHQAGSTSPHTFTKVGRKRESKSDEMMFGLDDCHAADEEDVAEDSEAEEIKEKALDHHRAIPLLRTHKFSSFDKRIWMQIEHRMIAFQATKHIFATVLRKEKGPSPSETDYLNFSLRLTSHCSERREFLRFWINIFLVYPKTATIINDQERLLGFWGRSGELDIGAVLQQYIERAVSNCENWSVDQMDKAFEYFRGRKGKTISPGCQKKNQELDKEEWWQCLRVNTFRHYLDFNPNSKLKAALNNRWMKKHTRETSNPKRKNPPPTPKRVETLGEIFDAQRQKSVLVGNRSRCSLQSLTESSAIPESTIPHNLPGLKDIGSLIEARELSRLTSTKSRNKGTKKGHGSASSLPNLANNLGVLDRFQMAVLDDLIEAGVGSELMINHGDGKYHLELSNFEFYLATLLKVRLHVRSTWDSSKKDHNGHLYSEGDAHNVIGRQKMDFIDPRNILHLARLGSTIIDDCIPKIDLIELSRALIVGGKSDARRSIEGFVAHVAAAGPQCYDDTGKPMCIGMGKKDCFFENLSLRKMIGQWLVFSWKASETIQSRARLPKLAIRPEFSNKLKAFFFVPEDTPMGYEAVTFRFQEIHPFCTLNHPHLDGPNCSLPTSCQTGATNICVIDPLTNIIYLLQIIVNFRAAVTAYCLPFYKSVEGINRHVLGLVELIQSSMNELYANKQLVFQAPSPLDMTNFFMDETLNYLEEDLGEGIKLKVVCLPIGLSRVFSLSSAIHVIRRAGKWLDFDGMVELCFVGCLLNTPTRFYYCLSQLLNDAEKGDFTFDGHPFNDWYAMTTKTFKSWQGGPKPRYSPAGADAGSIFGTTAKDGKGDQRLHDVVHELCTLLKWVDNQQGKDCLEDLPIRLVKAKMKDVCKRVRAATGYQLQDFGEFRLGIFLTHAMGSSLTKPGKHQRQLFYPTPSSASAHHMKNGCSDLMSKEEAAAFTRSKTDPSSYLTRRSEPPIDLDNFDTVLKLVCQSLNAPEKKYRDFMEVAMCESRPGRRLGRVDVLPQGVTLYDLNQHGQAICKKPGRGQQWVVVGQEEFDNWNKTRTRTHISYTTDDVIMECLVGHLAIAAKKTLANNGKAGRHLHSYQDSKASPDQQLMHFYHHSLYSFEKAAMRTSATKEMRVLANNNLAPISMETTAVSFESIGGKDGEAVLKYVKDVHLVEETRKGSLLLSGSFHFQGKLKAEEKGILSFYPPHKDKSMFEWVAFVPLQSQFWTVLAVPEKHFGLESLFKFGLKARLSDSNAMFEEFKQGLNDSMQEQIFEYTIKMSDSAKEHYKSLNQRGWSKIEFFYCLCKPGTILKFAAKEIWHGTITLNGDQSRDLLILHPFQE